MIQKTTELGIKNLFHNYVKEVLLEKLILIELKRYITEASEQSNRITVPKILEKQNLQNLLKLPK